jgi:hypothetical protein
MASDVLQLPKESSSSHSHVLKQEIPALQLVASENGQARWGPLIRLPRGAELHEFGEASRQGTLLVCSNRCFYIIFEQDLAESQSLKTDKRAAAQTA